MRRWYTVGSQYTVGRLHYVVDHMTSAAVIKYTLIKTHLLLLQSMAPNTLEKITQACYQSIFFNTNNCHITVS